MMGYVIWEVINERPCYPRRASRTGKTKMLPYFYGFVLLRMGHALWRGAGMERERRILWTRHSTIDSISFGVGTAKSDFAINGFIKLGKSTSDKSRHGKYPSL